VEYPLLSADWVKRRCTTSDPELAAAHLLGFLIYDDAIKSILRSRPPEKETIPELLDQHPEIETALDDKYFILLLINLFEQWFTHSKPRTALACLVADFQESDLLWTNDEKLPPGVAGLYDPADPSSRVDQEDYSSKLVLHKWLGGYVETLVKHPLLKTHYSELVSEYRREA
jgi:hypothetical protein